MNKIKNREATIRIILCLSVVSITNFCVVLSVGPKLLVESTRSLVFLELFFAALIWYVLWNREMNASSVAWLSKCKYEILYAIYAIIFILICWSWSFRVLFAGFISSRGILELQNINSMKSSHQQTKVTADSKKVIESNVSTADYVPPQSSSVASSIEDDIITGATVTHLQQTPSTAQVTRKLFNWGSRGSTTDFEPSRESRFRSWAPGNTQTDGGYSASSSAMKNRVGGGGVPVTAFCGQYISGSTQSINSIDAVPLSSLSNQQRKRPVDTDDATGPEATLDKRKRLSSGGFFGLVSELVSTAEKWVSSTTSLSKKRTRDEEDVEVEAADNDIRRNVIRLEDSSFTGQVYSGQRKGDSYVRLNTSKETAPSSTKSVRFGPTTYSNAPVLHPSTPSPTSSPMPTPPVVNLTVSHSDSPYLASSTALPAALIQQSLRHSGVSSPGRTSGRLLLVSPSSLAKAQVNSGDRMRGATPKITANMNTGQGSSVRPILKRRKTSSFNPLANAVVALNASSSVSNSDCGERNEKLDISAPSIIAGSSGGVALSWHASAPVGAPSASSETVPVLSTSMSSSYFSGFNTSSVTTSAAIATEKPVPQGIDISPSAPASGTCTSNATPTTAAGGGGGVTTIAGAPVPVVSAGFSFHTQASASQSDTALAAQLSVPATVDPGASVIKASGPSSTIAMASVAAASTSFAEQPTQTQATFSLAVQAPSTSQNPSISQPSMFSTGTFAGPSPLSSLPLQTPSIFQSHALAPFSFTPATNPGVMSPAAEFTLGLGSTVDGTSGVTNSSGGGTARRKVRLRAGAAR